MKYLDYITGLINETLDEVFVCKRKNLLGVAAAVRLDGGSVQKPKIVPGVYKGKGLGVQYAGFDDKFSLCGYHKALRTSSRRKPNSGYGDAADDVILTHEMVLVLFANTDEIGMTADQMDLMLRFVFPDTLKQHDLPKYFKAIGFNVNSTTLNNEQVFREEFQNVDFFLGPEHALIKVAYTVDSVLDKKCFQPSCESTPSYNP